MVCRLLFIVMDGTTWVTMHLNSVSTVCTNAAQQCCHECQLRLHQDWVQLHQLQQLWWCSDAKWSLVK